MKLRFFLAILFFFLCLFAAYNLSEKKLNLSLDLVGGSSLVLAGDFENYVNEINDYQVKTLTEEMKKHSIGYSAIHAERGKIYINLKDNVEDIKQVADGRYKLSISGHIAIFTLDQRYLDNMKSEMIEESVKNIKKRLDFFGNKEISVQVLGTESILVQAPGFNNTDELKMLIGKTAKLTFHTIDNGSNALTVYDGHKNAFKINKNVELDGMNIKDAYVGFGKNSKPVVRFSLTQEGSSIFAEITRQNIGKQLVILIDNEVISAPVVQDVITFGGVEISGNFSIEDAKSLAASLRAGALPIKLNVVQEKIIGATLGQELIAQGKLALIVAFAAITFVMVLIYGLIGITAIISVILNLSLVVCVMCISSSTLSLAGIAGLVLAVGMVVDSNVLIFERIREELRKNKSAYVSSVRAGFSKALSTIVDSNITTIAAAVMLFWFGDSNVKGFAITLTYGIIISFFTAVFFSKALIYDIQGFLIKYSFPKIIFRK